MTGPERRDLAERLVVSRTGSCTCATMSPHVDGHSKLCHYRLFKEALAAFNGDAASADYEAGAHAMREHVALIIRLAGHADLSVAILKTELPATPAYAATLDTVRDLLAMDADRPGAPSTP